MLIARCFCSGGSPLSRMDPTAERTCSTTWAFFGSSLPPASTSSLMRSTSARWPSCDARRFASSAMSFETFVGFPRTSASDRSPLATAACITR